MTLHYVINRLYYENHFYIYFGLFQLFFSFSLFCYLCADFTNHFRDPAVVHAEAIIFLLMATDFAIYHFVHEFKVTVMTVAEVIVLVGFSGCFAAIFCNGAQLLNEEIEMVLLLARFSLQILRLLLLMIRMRENNRKRSAATNIEITVNTTGAVETANGGKHFEMSVI